jgi:hypothetical protein
MGCGVGVGPTAAAAGDDGTSTSSARVFHSPQVPQRPDHLGAAAPQSEHRKTVRALAIDGPYAEGVTATATTR